MNPGRYPRSVALVTAGVLSVGLAACADDGQEALSPQAVPAATSAAPVAGGTLRIGMAAESGALDPHAFSANFLVLDGIYEALVGYGSEGELKPELAESWTVAPDGESVELDLRDGVRFHDGTPFDAEAVKWNLDRWVGKEDFSFFRASQVIDEVVVTDADTVTLELSEPYDPLLQELSLARPVRFLSPESVGAGDAFADPVGTGPWRFVSNGPTEAVLERNEDYWGERPLLDRLEFKVIPDSQSRQAALQAGEIDLIGGSYLAPVTPVEAHGLSTAGGVDLRTGEPDVTVMLGFNPDGPAGDRAVREAVAKAVDRDALIQALYLGYAQPAARFFPPSVPDSGKDSAPSYDRDGAAEVLDGAGYALSGDTRSKDGEELSLRFLVSSNANGMQDARGSAEAVAGALEEVGIDVDITFVDEAAYYEARTAGAWDIAFFETYGAPYDPSSTAFAFLATDATPVFRTDDFAPLVEAALFARNATERAARYQELYDETAEQVAFVPIAYRTRLYAVGDRVRGFAIPTTEYDLDLSGVSLG